MNSGRDNGRRVWNSLRYGSVGVVDDTGPAQMMQVQTSYLETFPSRPVVQHFGFASNPPANADAVLLSPNGDPSNSIVIGTNHQAYRPTGQLSGESMQYNAIGMSVRIKMSGFIALVANASMLITSPDVSTTGNFRAGTGATGSFTTPTGQIVTVRDGIITNIF